MDLYSKYQDADGRTFIIIQRLAKIVVIGKKMFDYPTTVTLLELDKEVTHEYDYKKIESWIKNGKLKQIPKNQKVNNV